ncbi:MAG: hypothetical protein JXP34_09975 [Planctomycetes bacterium]|nr:hypothetical protein [Planctomycetota bacterium]
MGPARLAAALGLLAFAGGCTVSVDRQIVGRRIDPAQVESLRVGREDRTRILEAFGPPDRIEAEPAGDIFHYYCIDSLDVQLEFPPPLDVGLSGALSQATTGPAGILAGGVSTDASGGESSAAASEGPSAGDFAGGFQRARAVTQEDTTDHLRLAFDAEGRLTGKTLTVRTLGPPALEPRDTRWFFSPSIHYVPISREDAGDAPEYRDIFRDGFSLEGEVGYQFLPFLCAFGGAGYRRFDGRKHTDIEGGVLRTLRLDDWVQVPMYGGLRLEIPFGLSWREWATMPYPPRLTGFVPFVSASGGVTYSKRVRTEVIRPALPVGRETYFAPGFLPTARFNFGLEYRWGRFIAVADVGLLVMWPPPTHADSIGSDADRFLTYPVRLALAAEF